MDVIAKSVSPKSKPAEESNAFGAKVIKNKDILIKQLDCFFPLHFDQKGELWKDSVTICALLAIKS